MSRLGKRVFAAVWIVLALSVVGMYYRWEHHSDLIGVVETRTHKLGALEAGRIQRILVALGDHVVPGQALVQLDTTDLDIEQHWLQEELQRLDLQTGADRKRYALEVDKLAVQSVADESQFVKEQAERAAKKAELTSVESEIERLVQAEQAGLGRSRELSDWLVKRDTLKMWLSQQPSMRHRSVTPGADMTPQSKDDVVASLLGKQRERISEITLRLASIAERRARRLVSAPCDGRVVNLNNLPGDVVDSFSTILTVEEPSPGYVDVFIPETMDMVPMMGERVRLYPHREGASSAEGTIVFIDPGYSSIPERLAFRHIVYWARKFRVKLDAGHSMMPGEAARVEMLDDLVDEKLAAAAETPLPSVRAQTDSAIKPIRVPESLLAKSRFEPSGLIWLADISRFLIVSDDTSRAKPEHAPWLFLMDTQGVVEPEPIVVEGTDALNDLESVTLAADGSIYLLSSQSASKRGKRPENRQRLLKVKRNGRHLFVVATVDFFAVLMRDTSEAERAALGLGAMDENGQLLLNIEGSAWRDGRLWLGLKQPVSPDGALLWSLDNPDALLASGRLSRGQLRKAGVVSLGEGGISDLMVGRDNKFYALSTIPRAKQDRQLGRFVRLDEVREGVFSPVVLQTFPGLKPEGISTSDGASYVIVFDEDDEPAHFFTGQWGRP